MRLTLQKLNREILLGSRQVGLIALLEFGLLGKGFWPDLYRNYTPYYSVLVSVICYIGHHVEFFDVSVRTNDYKHAKYSRKRLDQELKTCVEHRATLNLHQRGVGAVRFAPDNSKNTLLATASDDSHLIIWKYEPDSEGCLFFRTFHTVETIKLGVQISYSFRGSLFGLPL